MACLGGHNFRRWRLGAHVWGDCVADALRRLRGQPMNVGVSATILVIVIAGAWLRWRVLYKPVIWEDEITSASVAQKPVLGIIQWATSYDSHPPFYYMLSHLGYYHGLGILGSIRIPSLIAGILTVPLVYVLSRELTGQLAGIVTAAMVAVSPLAVWYSREGRMYALSWLFVVLSFWLMLRARRSWPWVVAYAFSVAFALWADVSSVLALLPQLAYLLYTRSGQALVGYAGGWILFIPWLPHLHQQATMMRGYGFAAYPASLATWRILLGDELGASASYASLGAIGFPVLLLLGYAAVAVVLAWKRPQSLPVVVAMSLGPLATAVFLLSIGVQAVLAPRVLGFTSFGFVMAVAVAAHVWRPLLAVGVGLVTISAVSVTTLEAQGSTGQSWNQIAAQLQRQAEPDDLVVYYPDDLRLAVGAYLPPGSWIDQGVGAWPEPDAVMDDRLKSWTAGHRRIWIVYLAVTGIDMPEHDSFLRTQGFVLLSGTPTAGMGVIEYSRASQRTGAVSDQERGYSFMPVAHGFQYPRTYSNRTGWHISS